MPTPRRLRYQFDPTFGMFACKEILPELIARFEALDEVCPAPKTILYL